MVTGKSEVGKENRIKEKAEINQKNHRFDQ